MLTHESMKLTIMSTKLTTESIKLTTEPAELTTEPIDLTPTSTNPLPVSSGTPTNLRFSTLACHSESPTDSGKPNVTSNIGEAEVTNISKHGMWLYLGG